jgi:uncharacterized protein YjbI with pentapeptide repeats
MSWLALLAVRAQRGTLCKVIRGPNQTLSWRGAVVQARFQVIPRLRKPGWRSVVGAALAVAVIVIVIDGYSGWAWAGVAPSTSPSHPQNTDYHPAKTLWDWLQLLIIPALIGLGGYWYNSQQQKRHDLELARQQQEHDLKLARDQQLEELLATYIDRLSDLWLQGKLNPLRERGDDAAEQDAGVHDLGPEVIRAHTLRVLRQLDSVRKGFVVRFLSEAGLLRRDRLIIALWGADLIGADLHGANLEEDDLRKANLQGAHLFDASLRKICLSQAQLTGADFHEADLEEADLQSACLEEAIMRDAVLRGSDLYHADRRGADLRDVKLQLADLRWSDLRGANLCGTDLCGTDLRGAHLGKVVPPGTQQNPGAGLHVRRLEIGARLAGARYNSKTQWPPDVNPKEAGAIEVTIVTNEAG